MIFSSSAFAFARTATERTGFGNSIPGKTIGAFFAHSVSPVEVFLSLTTAAMSPADTDSISFRSRPVIAWMGPMRSPSSCVEFRASLPALTVPEYTRRNDSSPTCCSATVLNTNPANGPFGSHFRSSFASDLGFVPTAGATSAGEGITPTMRFMSGSTPIFDGAEMATTGTTVACRTPARRPAMISSAERGCSLKNFSMSSSLDSAAASTSWVLHSATSSAMSAGMSCFFAMPEASVM